MERFTKYSLLIFSLFLSHSIYSEISPNLLKEKFVKVDRVSSKATGFYYGLREASSKRYITAKECRFTYEKGLDSHPKNDKEYAYERFMISFSGEDKKGENSFDSVAYGFSDYVEKYKPLDFSKGFTTIPLKQIELEVKGPSATMKATRSMDGELQMLFKHREVYSAKNSSFFLQGEEREYSVVVFFQRFDKESIQLKKISVEAFQTSKSNKKKIVEVQCLDFKEED